MKMSGRLLILILIAVFIQGQAPPVTGVQARGNADESTVTLEGIYTGWIEIDIRHSWNAPAPDVGLMENYFSFNYVRSRGRIDFRFVSGRPQQVNIHVPLTFYMISRQHSLLPGVPGDPCQGYYIFTTGRSDADHAGPGDGNSMTFRISPFTFMPESKTPTVTGTGGDCTPGIEPARQAALAAAEIEAMLPETFDWQFETTHWTKDKTSIDGTCSSADYEQAKVAAIQCFWHAFKLPKPTPLIVPPRKR